MGTFLKKGSHTLQKLSPFFYVSPRWKASHRLSCARSKTTPWWHQTVDKITDFRQFNESFDQTFSKVCGVEGQSPPRPSQRAKYLMRWEHEVLSESLAIPFLFLPSFSLCACGVKEKSGISEFVQTNKLHIFVLHSATTLWWPSLRSRRFAALSAHKSSCNNGKTTVASLREGGCQRQNTVSFFAKTKRR